MVSVQRSGGTILIISHDDKILFSSEGKPLAEAIMRRHRLAEVLVSGILKRKNSAMEEVTCKNNRRTNDD